MAPLSYSLYTIFMITIGYTKQSNAVTVSDAAYTDGGLLVTVPVIEF